MPADHPFKVGGIYEDCAYHPVLCTAVDEDLRELQGISLIDGSYPRGCSIDHCGPEPLTTADALVIRMNFDSYKDRREQGKEVTEALDDIPRTTH